MPTAPADVERRAHADRDRPARRWIATAIGLLASIGMLVASPASAGARSSTFTGLDRFNATYVIEPDGLVRVTEVLTAAFRGDDSHGIVRTITTRQNYEPKPDTDRVYEISDIRVTTEPGIANDVTTTEGQRDLTIRIGDPDQTIPPGIHTYTITYRIAGALNHFDDHDELYWNVTGLEWNRISSVRVTGRGPAPITRVACYAGSAGSRSPCASTVVNPDGSASIEDGPLRSEGVTMVLALPPGVITPTPEPILEARPAVSAWPLLIIIGISLVELIALCGAIVAFVAVRGRDRQLVGSAIDQAFANEAAEGEPVPVLGGVEIPVQFEPPDDLRPGLLGVIVDQEASTLAVSATIIDLASRGYLRLVEVEPTGLVFKHQDWRIDRMRSDVDGLEPYEVSLLDALFPATNSVVLSQLRFTFADSMTSIKRELIAGAMRRRWFRRDPASSAKQAKVLGIVMVVAGLVGSFTCFLTPFALPLVPAGILLWVLARYLPARTPMGTAMYRRALGFRRFITESEKYRAQYAERANIFTEYLPYAVMFGAATKWATTLKELGLAPQQPPAWYYGSGTFNPTALGAALSSFASTSASTLSSTPGASGTSGFGGGGFSGGGGGGGGGGGW